MSAQLDTTRINRDVQRLVEEIISHLTAIEGVNIAVSLEVNAEIEEGFSASTVRTIMENCKALKLKNYGIE